MTRAWLVFAVALTCVGRLHAQDTPRPTLDVIAIGPLSTLDTISIRIRAIEARLPVTVRWTTRAALDVRDIVAGQDTQDDTTQTFLAQVWLDLSAPDRAVLFIANASHDRFLVRVVPATIDRDRYSELTQESLATIVESAIDALLAGGQIGVDRSQAVQEIESQTGTRLAPAPSAVVIAAPATMPRPRSTTSTHDPAQAASSTLAIQYRADIVADGPTARHGLQLALAWAGRNDPAFDLLVAVTVHYAPPYALSAGGRGITEHGGGSRALIGATGHVSRRLMWQGSIGAGIDLARITPTVDAGNGLIAEPAFFMAMPMLTSLIAGAWRIAAWIELSVGVGVDVDLSGRHFDVAHGHTRTEAVSPWRAHPYAVVGVGMPFAF